ncbi:DNA transposition protein [Gilliamella sp. HK2]|uniref:AAA family ATPase n=1 Tax=unclassified Gilliamella TaxID=2685620 RepID=UPI00080D9EE2|nr:AAA family ATPase [Gilliamella apicola]OCG27210.1 DNA transposition protein [Gilliamella apicola]OCG29236.1 DNA transposition protein [Gilliamella apicola]
MFTGIRNEIKAAVENGEKYSAIAKQSDVSPTALSQFMNDSYSGDNQKIADKLTVWLDNKKKANNLKTAPSFVETPTSKKIFNALDYAKIAGCFVVVYGNSGVGKTNAITEYARQPNTWLITVRPSSAKLLECLYDIACALDIDYAPKRLGTLSSAICKKMRETKGLLIIDEADHLPYDALEEIRLIQEMTGVGVVLCGNHQIYSKLSGNGSRKTDFARLFSRIAKKVAILNTTEGDVDAIADAWGIHGDRERKIVHQLGKKAGALRIIKMTLSLAAILANSSNAAINETHISAAIRDLEGV